LQFKDSEYIEKSIQDNIHLHFFFRPSKLLQSVIPSILQNRETWGNNPLLGLKDLENPSEGRKRLVIEFSSPNIAKPFHQGHLRSTIIGGFLANLHESAGWDVVRLNYLGDWGKQYGLLAVGFELFGNEQALLEDPIQHLFQVYVKVNQQLREELQAIEKKEAAGEDVLLLKESSLDERARRYFKAMCDSDPQALELWMRFRELSIERYKKTYAKLNIHFDDYSGESQVDEKSMREIEKRVSELGLTSLDNGATIINFPKHVPGKEGKTLAVALMRKRDGTSLYLTRDLGGLFKRHAKHQFDKMVYVVADDQELHLKQLFKLVELLGDKELHSKLEHVNFGLVRGMSTRKGNVVFLDDVLQDVSDHIHQGLQQQPEKAAQVDDLTKTSDNLAISSVIIQDMRGKRLKGYTFDMKKMTAFEGVTGPYLQYSHARLFSIIKKAGVSQSEIAAADLNLLTEPAAINIVRLLIQYPDTLQKGMASYEPTNVLTYLLRLARAVHHSYASLRVIGSEREVMIARLALYDATRAVLVHGLRLLGLSPIERM
jgi:arginyl-tRNA synthetase